MKTVILEVMYIVTGLIAIVGAIYALIDKKHPCSRATAVFWLLFGLIFIIGKYLPPVLVGVMLIVMAIMTALNKVAAGSLKNAAEELRIKFAEKLGNKLFVPALAIGLVAFAVAQFIPSLGGLVGLGLGALAATLIGLWITRAPLHYIPEDGSRLLLQIGAASILPQLLAALGAVFNKAGIGEIISHTIGGIIGAGNALAGVIAYCLGMAVFTMIMGNAFAAFAVITAGIGIPFVYSSGANPVIAGALALTAGYCGTLMTPMAANFNIVPAALLETKNKYRVIISQLPLAILLLVTHILLMYTLAY